MKQDAGQTERTRLPFMELALLAAAVMALNALAIDIMLPALGQIGEEFRMRNANDRQLVVGVYIIANGAAQLFFGPIVDRFGRRTVLLGALGGYLAASLLSIAAPNYSLLLAARGLQGAATAGARVAIVAVVRDAYAGRRMAKLMSLSLTIFMAVPILAPAVGQLVLFFAPWRGIFLALFVYAAAVLAWVLARTPETLPAARRTPLRLGPVLAAYRTFVVDRTAMGYAIASACCFGGLFAYVSAAEQIFLEVYDLGPRFPLAFAAVAAAFGAASITNAALVERYGMRRLAHAALVLFVAINLTHLALIQMNGGSLIQFIVFVAGGFFCIGLFGPNASALAMENMGRVAGAAAAVYGFASTSFAGPLGALAARRFDGSPAPIAAGFAAYAIAALLIVLWTERGRLFRVGTDHEDLTDDERNGER